MYLEKILAEKGISKNAIAMKARIQPSDFYQAINGKRPFFPAWRRRIANTLGMPEEAVFPEFHQGKGEAEK
ncbi:MAG: hypothetical protein ACOX2N_04480 [Peptococcia bacterium]